MTTCTHRAVLHATWSPCCHSNAIPYVCICMTFGILPLHCTCTFLYCEMAERQRAFVPTDDSISAMAIGSRGVSWTDDQTKQLIHLSSQKKSRASLRIFIEINTSFESLPKPWYERTWIQSLQCREKIRNLRKGYKKVTDHNRTSGKGRKTCKFFKELDEILYWAADL